MNYYFTGSTKHLKEDQPRFRFIIEELYKLGHSNINYVHYSITPDGKKDIKTNFSKGKFNIYLYQTKLINQSEFLVADATRESTTIGYQIDYAISRKKPVLVFWNIKSKHQLPVMLTNDHQGLLRICRYKANKDIVAGIEEFTQEIISESIKFNLYINIKIHNYLTKVSEKENLTKSQIVRNILLKQIEKEEN